MKELLDLFDLPPEDLYLLLAQKAEKRGDKQEAQKWLELAIKEHDGIHNLLQNYYYFTKPPTK